jgi:hypothetical protein
LFCIEKSVKLGWDWYTRYFRFWWDGPRGIEMDSFPGDYYGYRCHSGKESSDIFNDYLDLLDGVLAYDESEINL